MTKCVIRCQTGEVSLGDEIGPNERVVRLYATNHGVDRAGYIGNTLLDKVERLAAPTSTAAFDFLTISMAVTAADTFFKRETCSENAWARDFEVHVSVVKPSIWNPVKERLQKTLNFLTGDQWSFHFVENGPCKPNAVGGRRKKKSNLTGVDSVCLYSGGLDSWLGVKSLLKSDRNPILVSHAYPQDAKKQNDLYGFLPKPLQRFAFNASPRIYGCARDTTMRGRSFNFLALGAVAADAVASLNNLTEVPLYIPENGFIALNAPLTSRRVGSHSTRTAHPFYLSCMQEIFDAVGIKAKIHNPFRDQTKGEMLQAAALSPREKTLATSTVSCGKWKRKSQQCGRCVPCLIRRAAFHAAGIDDSREVYTYGVRENFEDTDGLRKDDLHAVLQAVLPASDEELKKRSLKSGPLPLDVSERAKWMAVHKNGLAELRAYLVAEGVIDD